MNSGALFLLLPVVFSWGYDVVGTLCFRQWLREKSPAGPDTPPITVFRPLKRKVPGLEAKLADLCLALEKGDQLLIGVYADDEQRRLVAEILAQYPRMDAQMVLCEPERCPNPKINKLLQLSGHARHEHWMILDAEVENARAFLPAFRREWTARGFPVFSALYRFRRMNLDVAPVVETLWPGLALLRKFGTIRLTLGACLALTRRQVAKLGGWETFGNDLAEDFQIGQNAAQAGEAVALSKHLAALDNDPPGIKNLLLHQHRVAVTYRVCQPAGFAGALFTHGPSFALVLALWQPSEGWRWGVFALSLASRIFAVLARCRAAGWEVPGIQTAAQVSVGSLAQTALWLTAWLPWRVCWAGRRWRISADGRMRN